jgi:hypothetical protein
VSGWSLVQIQHRNILHVEVPIRNFEIDITKSIQIKFYDEIMCNYKAKNIERLKQPVQTIIHNAQGLCFAQNYYRRIFILNY